MSIQTVTTSNDKTLSFNITPKQIARLVKQQIELYRNPIIAAIQEIGSNCDDTLTECFDLGMGRKPFSVQITQIGDYIQVTIADEGLGMTEQEFLNHYWKLGNSSKEKSTKTTGKFGIGAKSVLAVTPYYTVVTKSYQTGETLGFTLKKIMKEFENELLPTFEYEKVEVADLPLEHGTVTQFSLPYNNENLKEISYGLYQISLMGCQIEVDQKIQEHYSFRYEKPEFTKVNLGGKTYLYTDNSYYRGKVVVGNVPYYTNGMSPYWSNNSPILPTFKNSDVSYNETREYLQKDTDDTSGNLSLMTQTYEDLRNAIIEEYYKQNDKMDCSELEYFTYVCEKLDRPKIYLNGQTIEIDFINKKLFPTHKVWGDVLEGQNLLPIYKLYYDYSGLVDVNIYNLTDKQERFEKEKQTVSIKDLAASIEQLPLIYNARATQKTFGYYFDKYLDQNSEYSDYRVRITSETLLDNMFPTDKKTVEGIVKMWRKVHTGDYFDFMVKVVSQWMQRIKDNSIDGKILSDLATEEKYNFKKERGIKKTYNTEINLYTGISYKYKERLDPSMVEESDEIFVYVVGRNTCFNQFATNFNNLKRDYKKIMGIDYPLKVNFLSFNKTDFNKKAFQEWLDDTDNMISDKEFADEMLITYAGLWKTVMNYLVKTNIYDDLISLRNEINHNKALKVLFSDKLDFNNKVVNLNLVQDNYNRYIDLNVHIETFYMYQEVDDFVKSLKEKAYKKKFDWIANFKSKMSKLQEIFEWMNFMHNKKAFEYGLQILKEEGITFTDAEITKMKETFE